MHKKVMLIKDQKKFGCNSHVETEFLWHTAVADWNLRQFQRFIQLLLYLKCYFFQGAIELFSKKEFHSGKKIGF